MDFCHGEGGWWEVGGVLEQLLIVARPPFPLMGAIAEGFLRAESTAAQVNLVTFFNDIAGFVLDDVGAGDFIGSIFKGSNNHRIAHEAMLVLGRTNSFPNMGR